jgi:hypothetical protein
MCLACGYVIHWKAHRCHFRGMINNIQTLKFNQLLYIINI